MTDELLGVLLPRVQRELGIDDPDYDQLIVMEDGLRDAEAEVLLYLNANASEVPAHMSHVLVRIAAINCQHLKSGQLPAGVKSSSYTEGDVSRSLTMLTAAEIQAAKDSLLRPLAQHRRRARC